MLDPETGEVPANGHVRTVGLSQVMQAVLDITRAASATVAGSALRLALAQKADPTPAEFAAWEAAGRTYPPPWVTEKHAGRYEQSPPGGGPS